MKPAMKPCYNCDQELSVYSDACEPCGALHDPKPRPRRVRAKTKPAFNIAAQTSASTPSKNPKLFAWSSETTTEPYSVEAALASRWSRLWAHFTDVVCATVVQGTLFVVGFGAGTVLGLEYGIPVGLFMASMGMLVLVLYNMFLMATSGQTLGKRTMRIRVVPLDSPTRPIGFLRGVVLRGFTVPFFAATILLMAPSAWMSLSALLLLLVNMLMIFRLDRRCLHDILAQSAVVGPEFLVDYSRS
jgi:uncharacterized RDD family membrane protein YckC